MRPSERDSSAEAAAPAAGADAARMASYELPAGGAESPAPKFVDAAVPARVSVPLLYRSILWMCRLRWTIAAGLAAFGVLGLFPDLLARIGLRPGAVWPFAVAAVLAAANVGFLLHARRPARLARPLGGEANLWTQIVTDLLVLTVVVHYVGSLETYVSFAYLFHIVLACIFFPRGRSFVVTALACVLYVTCVALEETGAIPLAGIYADPSVRKHIAGVPSAPVLDLVWATVTWIVVWHLASHLSEMVRQRDEELAETNRRLLEANEEKARHIVRTTHELKAPFAAIDANAQLLLKGHCGPLTDDARDIVGRIAARCRRLAGQIQEMLQVVRLQVAAKEPPRLAEVDLADALRWCIAQVRPIAEEREVELTEDLRPARTTTVEEHARILLSNLLSNAVHYSRPGGRVRVQCGTDDAGEPLVTVEDNGIGMPGEKLPRIFDAYYRTDEAVRHYKQSTGLGLAIVKHVAEMLGLRLRVESALGVGTRFTVHFGGPSRSASGRTEGDRTWPT